MIKFLLECAEIFVQHTLYLVGVLFGGLVIGKLFEKKGEKS